MTGNKEAISPDSADFDYRSAFARNIGWITTAEQQVLRGKRVAIAGMGGVGGSHLLTLTRLGIGHFHISDFDHFELANFNRQAGASLTTLGKSKADSLAKLACDINPTLDIQQFPDGINTQNIEQFLDGMDLYLDGLDYFAVSARRTVFEACAKLGIPAVTAAPLGMGTAVLNFLPGDMTFEEYFRLEGQSEQEQLIRFLLGLSPAMLQRGYLVDPGAVDFATHRGPSTPMACELCAGVAATEVLKILLNRGKVYSAPHGIQFDAYRSKMVHTWRPGGNHNPLQRIGLTIARRQIARMTSEAEKTGTTSATPASVIEQILDLARWAPSGDNTQPWRFEIKNEQHVVIHGHDTRDHCVYDLEGHASQLSLGTLLETIRIAATGHGLETSIRRRDDAPETHPVFDVTFAEDSSVKESQLIPYIQVRSVQRRAMRTRPLSDREKHALELSLGNGYRMIWFEGLSGRWQVTKLIFKNAGLRLTLPEAYPTHRDVIAWNSRFSEDRIPDQAVGLDPLTSRISRWALQRWERVSIMNRYLGGTILPRTQLELIPGLACAAHFAIVADAKPATIDDYIAAGRSLQRFWLTATQLGLFIQPEMTPIIFHEYVENNIPFTEDGQSMGLARKIATLFESTITTGVNKHVVFMGRIGAGPSPSARSVRLPLAQLQFQPD